MPDHCCEAMDKNLRDQDTGIVYSEKFREYGIRVLDGGSSFQQIDYCPWCGQKFASSLRDLWFDIVYDELELDSANDPGLPEDMKSDVWWKKRDSK